MKLAFISDIHANLPALEAVLADIETRQAQALYCLGDLVGYAPWPNEVVQTFWANRIPTIAGNYDHGVGLGSDDCGCAYKTEKDQMLGAESIAYTNSVVTDEVRRYLRTLPRHLELEQDKLASLPCSNELGRNLRFSLPPFKYQRLRTVLVGSRLRLGHA